MPTHCLINSNLIRPLTGSSLGVDGEEEGGTLKQYEGEKKKIQLVSMVYSRNLS